MRERRTMLILGIGAVVFFLGRAQAQTLTVEQAIREVCTNSDSVKMMKETIKKADESVREKWANAWPVISATGAAVHNYGSALGGSSGGSSGSSRPLEKAASTFTPMDSGILSSIGSMLSEFSTLSQPVHSNIYTAGISFNQPIYTFGKIGDAVKVAEEFRKSTLESYKRNLQTLQLTALDLFFQVVLTQKAAEVSEHSLARKRELYSFLKRNFDLGSGSKAQVLATKADVATQVSNAIIAKRDALTARMNLNTFMGVALTDSIPLDTADVIPVLLVRPNVSVDDAVKTALANRTDLKSLKLISEAYKGGAKIFRAMYLPTIGATGSAGYTRMDSDSKLIGNNNTNPSWSLGVGAQWTLFDGFSNSAKAAQYQSDGNKLDIIYNLQVKGIESTVRSWIAECVAQDTNFVASKERYESASQSFELTNNNFKQGSGQFSDLKQADDLLRQSEYGVTSALYLLVRSHAGLLVAMGQDIIKIDENQKTK
jgi:HAE1 family hydrophobic/amphiphilic exporter-1